MKKFKNTLFLLLCGAAFIALGVGSTSETSTEKSSNGSGKEKFSYTIDTQYADTFAYYIEGVMTNNTNKDYSYVEIDFICYDAEGNNLGTALDNTNNLLGGQTWKYKAMFFGSNEELVDHCDYHETTAW